MQAAMRRRLASAVRRGRALLRSRNGIALLAAAALSAGVLASTGAVAPRHPALERFLESESALCVYERPRDLFTIQRGADGALFVVEGRAPRALLEAMVEEGFLDAPVARRARTGPYGAAERPTYRVRAGADNPVSERGLCVGRRDVFEIDAPPPRAGAALGRRHVRFKSVVELADWYRAIEGDPLGLGAEHGALGAGEAVIHTRDNGFRTLAIAF